MFGIYNKPQEFIEVPAELVRSEAYYNNTDPYTVSEVTFQLNRDLRMIQFGDGRDSIMYACALTGGLMFLIYAVLKAFFQIYVPWLMYAETVRLLFKIDPRKPKKPRSELRLAKKDPAELLREAQESVRAQVWITSNFLDRIVLTFESFASVLFSCRNNKFSRIVNEGSNQIKNELNIIKFVRSTRFIECALANLVNNQQKRLIDQQAKSVLVIKPLSNLITPLGTLRKKYEDSSDYTSDEDFDFIERALNGEDGKLDAMTLKMLRGILQAPPDEKKRDSKPGYKSKKRRRGAGGSDASFSDSVDEYGNEDGTFEALNKDRDLVVALPGTDMAKLKPGAMTGNDGSYVDENGLLRDKKGKLIRPKGMSEKEWRRLLREEELRRM